MKRISITLTAVLALARLSACTEKPQTGGGVKQDAAPFAGTGSNFPQPGWKAADKAGRERPLQAQRKVREPRQGPQASERSRCPTPMPFPTTRHTRCVS